MELSCWSKNYNSSRSITTRTSFICFFSSPSLPLESTHWVTYGNVNPSFWKWRSLSGMNYEFQSQRKVSFWLSRIFQLLQWHVLSKSTVSTRFLDWQMNGDWNCPPVLFPWPQKWDCWTRSFSSCRAIPHPLPFLSIKSRGPQGPAINCYYSLPTIYRPFLTYHLPTLAIF